MTPFLLIGGYASSFSLGADDDEEVDDAVDFAGARLFAGLSVVTGIIAGAPTDGDFSTNVVPIDTAGDDVAPIWGDCTICGVLTSAGGTNPNWGCGGGGPYTLTSPA